MPVFQKIEEHYNKNKGVWEAIAYGTYEIVGELSTREFLYKTAFDNFNRLLFFNLALGMVTYMDELNPHIRYKIKVEGVEN
jgi:hypothetical protein